MAVAAQPEREEHKQAAAVQQAAEEHKQAAAAQRAARRIVVAEQPVLAAVQKPEAAQEWVGLARALQVHLPENRISHRSGCHPTYYCRIGRRTYQHLLVKGKLNPTIGVSAC
jgi:hypothetical protein